MGSRHLPVADRFAAKVDRSGGPAACWPWVGTHSSDGYGSITIDHHTIGAHRVAWELANGPIPKGLSVLHRCDNRPCCNDVHLWLGTQAENMRDCAAKGRSGKSAGELHHNHSLTAEQVVAIREQRAAGASLRELSDRYGVTRSNISHIALRRSWAHV